MRHYGQLWKIQRSNEYNQSFRNSRGNALCDTVSPTARLMGQLLVEVTSLVVVPSETSFTLCQVSEVECAAVSGACNGESSSSGGIWVEKPPLAPSFQPVSSENKPLPWASTCVTQTLSSLIVILFLKNMASKRAIFYLPVCSFASTRPTSQTIDKSQEWIKV